MHQTYGGLGSAHAKARHAQATPMEIDAVWKIFKGKGKGLKGKGKGKSPVKGGSKGFKGKDKGDLKGVKGKGKGKFKGPSSTKGAYPQSPQQFNGGKGHQGGSKGKGKSCQHCVRTNHRSDQCWLVLSIQPVEDRRNSNRLL